MVSDKMFMSLSTLNRGNGMIAKKKKIYSWQVIALWTRSMSRSAKGKATLSNVIYAWRKSCLSKKIIVKSLLTAARSWMSSSPDILPEESMQQAFASLSPTFFCRGVKVTKTPIPCSRVMNLQDLIRYNIDLANTGLSIKGRITAKQANHFERFGFKKCAIGEMKTRRPFSWVTPTAALNDLRVKYPLDIISTVSRKLLGLLAFQEDEHMVELQYPIMKIHPRVPTFLEGSPSLIFRAKRATDGWGRTVNLETLDDGLPEAVYPKIPFTSDFKLIDMGPLHPVDNALNWEKFIITFPYPWHSKIMREVINYVRSR